MAPRHDVYPRLPSGLALRGSYRRNDPHLPALVLLPQPVAEVAVLLLQEALRVVLLVERRAVVLLVLVVLPGPVVPQELASVAE